MVNLIYNNQSNTDLITFTDVPNLLTVADYGNSNKTIVKITLSSSLQGETTTDNQWYIKVFDNTMSNVLDGKNAINKSFVITSDAASTAFSLVKALRQCPNVAANFKVELGTDSGYYALLTSRNNGSILYDGWFSTNIDSSYCSSTTVQNGAMPLQDTQVNVDIYNGDNYITTLTKQAYDGEAVFDVSPVLATFAYSDRTVPYTMKVSTFSANTVYNNVGTIGTNHVIQGYMVNQGDKFFQNNNVRLAMNLTRGEQQKGNNHTILYTYGNEIPLSIYMPNNTGGLSNKYVYYDSAFQPIYSATTSWTKQYSESKIYDLTFAFNHQGNRFFNDAYYLGIQLGSSYSLIFDVIKPSRTSEENQRIYWRNCYGGIQFFDFCGQRSESRSMDTTTYQKGIFDFYESDINELDKVFDIDADYTVTLKSHLIEKDAIYIFNDLIQAKNVWTYINGQKYAIIIKNVSVEETTQNGVYTATAQYYYSQKPSLM